MCVCELYRVYILVLFIAAGIMSVGGMICLIEIKRSGRKTDRRNTGIGMSISLPLPGLLTIFAVLPTSVITIYYNFGSQIPANVLSLHSNFVIQIASVTKAFLYQPGRNRYDDTFITCVVLPSEVILVFVLKYRLTSMLILSVHA